MKRLTFLLLTLVATAAAAQNGYDEAGLKAFRAERDVAKDRNIVVERDHRTARRTPGVRKDNRLLVRNTMNHHVEETADDGTENSGKNVTDDWGD